MKRFQLIVLTLILLLSFSSVTFARRGKSSTLPETLSIKLEQINLRSAPKEHAQVVKVIHAGAPLTNTFKQKGKWQLVETEDGTKGWISRKYLRPWRDTTKQIAMETQEKSSKKSSRVALKSAEKKSEKLNENVIPIKSIDQIDMSEAIRDYVEDLKHKRFMYPQDKLFLIIEDLQTGERIANINGNTQVKAASLIKVPFLHAYMMLKYRNKVPFNAKIQRDLVLMIRYSSNIAANKVLEMVGGPARAEALLQTTGHYKNMRIVEYIPDNGRTYQNRISAEDLNRVYVKLWKHQILGPSYTPEENQQASEEILYILGMPSTRGVHDRLKDRTCFSSDNLAKVWDKTGFVRGLNGNAGIIEIATPQGRRAYTIIPIIDRLNYESIPGSGHSWASRQSSIIRQISEMTYAYMKIQYGSTTSCGYDRLVKFASPGTKTASFQSPSSTVLN